MIASGIDSHLGWGEAWFVFWIFSCWRFLMSTFRSRVVIRFIRLRSMPSNRWKIFEKSPTVSNGVFGTWIKIGNHNRLDFFQFGLKAKKKRRKKFWFNVSLQSRKKRVSLRCWREFVAAAPLPCDSLLISVLIRFIFNICKSSLTADCGILNVLAQSNISCTVMSAELLSCVLLVSNSSKGSSLMFINSSTCCWSSLRVMVIGTETTEVGVWDGGTICVLLVMMIVSLALRFFKFIFCCFEIGVIVISLFSISFKICWAIVKQFFYFNLSCENKMKREIC